jgi:peroxiredoxin
MSDTEELSSLVNRRMPAVTLPATDGSLVTLNAPVAGRSVIYIYPMTGRPDVPLPDGWDDIPGARGCTAEACGFRDHLRELLGAGAGRVFGLSSQPVDYQREMADRLGLTYPVLSDEGFELARALSLPTFEASGLVLYRRQTLVVHGGLIEHVFHPVPAPGEHAEQVLAWLTAQTTKEPS